MYVAPFLECNFLQFLFCVFVYFFYEFCNCIFLTYQILHIVLNEYIKQDKQIHCIYTFYTLLKILTSNIKTSLVRQEL